VFLLLWALGILLLLVLLVGLVITYWGKMKIRGVLGWVGRGKMMMKGRGVCVLAILKRLRVLINQSIDQPPPFHQNPINQKEGRSINQTPCIIHDAFFSRLVAKTNKRIESTIF
jgi:hypothetical protein